MTCEARAPRKKPFKRRMVRRGSRDGTPEASDALRCHARNATPASVCREPFGAVEEVVWRVYRHSGARRFAGWTPSFRSHHTRSLCISAGATCLDLCIAAAGKEHPGDAREPWDRARNATRSNTPRISFLHSCRMATTLVAFCCQCGRHSSCLSRPCRAIAWRNGVACRLSGVG